MQKKLVAAFLVICPTVLNFNVHRIQKQFYASDFKMFCKIFVYIFIRH